MPSNQDLTAAEVRLLTTMAGPRAAAAQCAQAHLRPVRSHPHRLPAGAQHAHAQRAGGGAERADPDAVRVLRARGAVRAGRHHRADQGVGESRPRDRRHPAHHVRSAKQSRQRSLEPAHQRISATRCSAPSCRATCGSPRRRPSASPSCSTTRTRAARWPISRWPAKCCARTTTRPSPPARRSCRRPKPPPKANSAEWGSRLRPVN